MTGYDLHKVEASFCMHVNDLKFVSDAFEILWYRWWYMMRILHTLPYPSFNQIKSTDLILATFLALHSLKTFWIRCNKVMGILKYGNTSKIPFQTLSKTLYYGYLLNPSPCVSFQSVVIKSFNWRVSFWKIHTLWCSLFKN